MECPGLCGVLHENGADLPVPALNFSTSYPARFGIRDV